MLNKHLKNSILHFCNRVVWVGRDCKTHPVPSPAQSSTFPGPNLALDTSRDFSGGCDVKQRQGHPRPPQSSRCWAEPTHSPRAGHSSWQPTPLSWVSAVPRALDEHTLTTKMWLNRERSNSSYCDTGLPVHLFPGLFPSMDGWGLWQANLKL